jgi:hypothetical protein
MIASRTSTKHGERPKVKDKGVMGSSTLFNSMQRRYIQLHPMDEEDSLCK